VKQSVKGLEKCKTQRDLWKTFSEPSQPIKVKAGSTRMMKVSSHRAGKVRWSQERDYTFEANDDGTGSWVVK
jgi:hypothetical protein